MHPHAHPWQVHVDTYRAAEGGWLRLALTQVAGDGDISSVQLAPSQASTRAFPPLPLPSCPLLSCPCLLAVRQSQASPSPYSASARPDGPALAHATTRGVYLPSCKRCLHCSGRCLLQSPDAWRPMQRSFGATWELSALPPPPLDLRATDATGQTIVARCVKSGSCLVFGCSALHTLAMDSAQCPAGVCRAACSTMPPETDASKQFLPTALLLRHCRRALQQAGLTGDAPTSAQFQASATLAAALGQPAAAPTAPVTSAPLPAPLPAPDARGPATFQSVFGPSPAARAPAPELPVTRPPPMAGLAPLVSCHKLSVNAVGPRCQRVCYALLSVMQPTVVRAPRPTPAPCPAAAAGPGTLPRARAHPAAAPPKPAPAPSAPAARGCAFPQGCASRPSPSQPHQHPTCDHCTIGRPGARVGAPAPQPRGAPAAPAAALLPRRLATAAGHRGRIAAGG